MRIRLSSTALALALALAASLLVACGNAGDAPGASAGGMPSTLPATVEGVVYFDLGESELEPSDLTAAMTTEIGFDAGDDGDLVMLRVRGDQLAATGATGEGERVRATLSAKSHENGQDYYTVTALERL